MLVGTQPLNSLGEVLSSLIWILMLALFLVLSEETLFLHKRVVDELVEQELVKDIQLLYQELVECVDDCAHYPNTVSLDRIKHLVGANCFDLSGLLCRLDKDLSMDVVVVLGNKFSKFSQQLHNINTLLKLLRW